MILRDLPDADLLDGGHWLLETNLAEAADLTRDLLQRVHTPAIARLNNSA